MRSYSLRTVLLTTLVTAASLLPGAAFATTQNPAPAAPAASVPPPSAADKNLAETHERIKRCANMQELGIRIACYDDYAVELGYITPDRAKADSKKFDKIGVWQITKKDNGRGMTQIMLRSESLNKLSTPINGFERHIGLVISCVPGKTEAMIDWKVPVVAGLNAQGAVPKALVNYNTENSQTFIEEWEASTDKLALFAPDAIAFGRNLMNKKTLTFSLGRGGNSTSNIVRFNIEGIDSALDEIVKGCYSHAPQNPQ